MLSSPNSAPPEIRSGTDPGGGAQQVTSRMTSPPMTRERPRNRHNSLARLRLGPFRCHAQRRVGCICAAERVGRPLVDDVSRRRQSRLRQRLSNRSQWKCHSDGINLFVRVAQHGLDPMFGGAFVAKIGEPPAPLSRQDVAALIGRFGSSALSAEEGDLTGDGRVELVDLAMLQHYLAAPPSSAGAELAIAAVNRDRARGYAPLLRQASRKTRLEPAVEFRASRPEQPR